METAFKNVNISRVVAVTLIPGFVAVLPALLFLHKNYPGISSYLQQHSEILILLAFMVSYTAGTIIEDLGSFLEKIWCDKRVYAMNRAEKIKEKNETDLDNEEKLYTERWYKYLKLELESEKYKIGHRFISNMVTRLKLELSMGIALPLSASGLWFLNEFIAFWILILYSILAILISSYLILLEAPKTAHSLDATRKTLLES